MLLLGKHGIIFLYIILTSLYVLYGHWYLTTPWPQAIMMTRLKLKDGFTRKRDVHSTMAFQIDKLFFWTKLYMFFMDEMKWNPIYLGVFPPNVAAISSMMNYSNMIEETSETPWYFGTFRDRWNWMDSSLPDGIRWLLDDKTHKGCHGSEKKGMSIHYCFRVPHWHPFEGGRYIWHVWYFVKLHFGGRFHLRWRCDH